MHTASSSSAVAIAVTTGRALLRTAVCGALTLGLLSGCHWLKLTSVSSAGAQADAAVVGPVLSGDGRYMAFFSNATNLVANDTNGTTDVFLHDLQAGTTTRVSVTAAGAQGDTLLGNSDAALSADGRYVAFVSRATNLVAGDTNGVRDIFVRDTVGNTTTRVSLTTAGGEGNSNSYEPAISADGRYVAFSSNATNLVADDFNGVRDVFVRDTVAGGTVRVSVDSAGNEGDGASDLPAISADGRYVAYASDAGNLVAGDTNLARDVFLHDTQTGTTIRVSVDSAGAQASFFLPGFVGGDTPAISGDGRFVAFVSEADNLVSGDSNLVADVFLYDTQTARTTRVSVDSLGGQAGGFSEAPSLSADGRYVAFTSIASNLVSGDTNFTYDVFLHDTLTGATSRQSLSALGGEANGTSASAALSADGRYVAFVSDADNLVAGDVNVRRDAFIRATPQLAITSVVPDHLPIGATTSVTINGDYFLPGTSPLLPGAQLTNIVMVDENTITMDVTIDPAQTAGARSLVMKQLGTGAGDFTGVAVNCLNCVTFQ